MVVDLRLIEHKTTESNHLLDNYIATTFVVFFSTAVNLSLMEKHFGRVFELFNIKCRTNGN